MTALRSSRRWRDPPAIDGKPPATGGVTAWTPRLSWSQGFPGNRITGEGNLRYKVEIAAGANDSGQEATALSNPQAAWPRPACSRETRRSGKKSEGTEAFAGAGVGVVWGLWGPPLIPALFWPNNGTHLTCARRRKGSGRGQPAAKGMRCDRLNCPCRSPPA